MTRTGGILNLEDDGLAACVACGLCLPHCPSYRVTGDERKSPRGRIELMRAIDQELLELDTEVSEAIDSCLMCRGCESACPSEVPFGELMSETRAVLVKSKPISLRLRVGLGLLKLPWLLRAGSRLLAVLQRLRLCPSGLPVPNPLPLWDNRARSRSTADVILFTGCVMDVWQPEVHAAVESVVEASGVTVRRSGDRTGCCGALHMHAGLTDSAKKLANRVISRLSGTEPILVDSAGCGAALREYGTFLGTADALKFSERVKDVHEWLAERTDRLPPPEMGKVPVVAVQDPCHLRHAQRVHTHVRTVLAPYAETVELDDEGLCCGAGGLFSVLQPELAGKIKGLKIEAIERAFAESEAQLIVSGNPGCSMHIASSGYQVLHPLQVVAARIATGGDKGLKVGDRDVE